MAQLESFRRLPDWWFAISWSVATTLALALATFLGVWVWFILARFGSMTELALLTFPVSVTFLALAQMLVLQRYVGWARAWFWASFAAGAVLVVPFLVAQYLLLGRPLLLSTWDHYLYFTLALSGGYLGVGVAQWHVLWSPVSRSQWWLAASAMSPALVVGVYSYSGPLALLSLIVVVVGPGLGLLWMLRSDAIQKIWGPREPARS